MLDFTGSKLLVASTSLFGGLLATIPDGIPAQPQALTGYGSIILASAAIIWTAMGEYKRRQADTSKAILNEKLKLIEQLEKSNTYLIKLADAWKVEAEKSRQELVDYHNMHHAFRTSMQPLMWRNAAMETLLLEKGIPLPLPPQIAPV